jgi:hypothetical protein
MENLPALPENQVESLISMALQQNVPVESLKELLEMRRELRAEYAKAEFDAAKVRFQTNCPIIKKEKEVRNKFGVLLYKFAPIEYILTQVGALMRECGFSYSFETETFEKTAKATCILNHTAGHSEGKSVELPFMNKTEAMSQAQVVEGTLTVCIRKAFCNVLGILTADEDFNAQVTEEKISDTSIEKLRELLLMLNFTEEYFLQRKKLITLTQLNETLAQKYIEELEVLKSKKDMKNA